MGRAAGNRTLLKSPVLRLGSRGAQTRSAARVVKPKATTLSKKSGAVHDVEAKGGHHEPIPHSPLELHELLRPLLVSQAEACGFPCDGRHEPPRVLQDGRSRGGRARRPG